MDHVTIAYGILTIACLACGVAYGIYEAYQDYMYWRKVDWKGDV